MKWFRRVTSSLLGVMAMFQVGFSLPLCVFFLHQDYLDDNLTKSQVTLEIGVWLIAGVVTSLLFWYTVSLPLLKKLERRRQR
jgi:riboflavin transporter FmnP